MSKQISKRSKVDIEFIENINNQLKNARLDRKEETQLHLQGLCSALETYMRIRNIYAGFKYLSKDEIPFSSEPPGINDDLTFENTNPFRRMYF